MSGGEYGLLFLQEEALPALELERMAARLDELGASGAADATRRLIPPPPDDPLRRLWRAVEYRDSGDTSPETLCRALDEYEALRSQA